MDDPKKTKISDSKSAVDQDDDDADVDLEAVNLTADEMSEVCQFHHMVFTCLAATLWHQSLTKDAEDELGYVAPVISGYLMAAHLGKKLWLLIG